MCGISGVAVQGDVTETDRDAVAAMIRAQRHRGPDRQRMEEAGPCVLGHDRLAVLDLSVRGDQPMRSSCGRYYIVFNGEIYNYSALAEEFFPQRQWRSSGDTEVLLELFAAQGPSCFALLNGMFALAVWDTRERRLFLARDRFGQKPLFYGVSGSRFLFSSEVLALFRHPLMERRPDLNALYHYLSVQSVPAPFSAFAGVRKLPPAHWLEWHDGEIHLRRYWSPALRPVFSGTAEEAEEELDARLHAAVARHLVSDVPVGVFLSGGVDSSLMAALACRREKRMHSFCVGFDLPEYDERPFAAQAAACCGCRHTAAVAAPDVADMLPRMVRHYGEPFADSSALPAWLLCATARRSVTVALSGDGGDDLFGGYQRYLSPYLFADPPYPADITKKYTELMQCLDSAPESGLLRRGLTPAAAAYYFYWARFCGEHKERLCSSALKQAARPSLTLITALEHFASSGEGPLLDKIQRFELEYYLGTTLMPKMDTAAMAVSLEVRAPLLDTEVADFALSLPPSLRVRRLAGKHSGSFQAGWEAKWLLKKVACRYFPEKFVYRRKQGFGVPLGQWLSGELRPLMEEELLSSGAAITQWVERAEVARIVNEHLSGKINHQYRLWALLMLALWARHCLAGEFGEGD